MTNKTNLETVKGDDLSNHLDDLIDDEDFDVGESDELFYLYAGDDVTIWDAVEEINEKLKPYGIGFATGCDDDYGFAKLVKVT